MRATDVVMERASADAWWVMEYPSDRPLPRLCMASHGWRHHLFNTQRTCAQCHRRDYVATDAEIAAAGLSPYGPENEATNGEQP